MGPMTWEERSCICPPEVIEEIGHNFAVYLRPNVVLLFSCWITQLHFSEFQKIGSKKKQRPEEGDMKGATFLNFGSILVMYASQDPSQSLAVGRKTGTASSEGDMLFKGSRIGQQDFRLLLPHDSGATQAGCEPTIKGR